MLIMQCAQTRQRQEDREFGINLAKHQVLSGLVEYLPSIHKAQVSILSDTVGWGWG